MLLLLADLAVATAAAGGLALLLTSLTFASHAWFASVPQRPAAAGTRALRGEEDPTGALFTFMLKGYVLALIVTHVHAWCDGPLATQHGQVLHWPMPTRPTHCCHTPTRLLGVALQAREERPRHLNTERWLRPRSAQSAPVWPAGHLRARTAAGVAEARPEPLQPARAVTRPARLWLRLRAPAVPLLPRARPARLRWCVARVPLARVPLVLGGGQARHRTRPRERPGTRPRTRTRPRWRARAARRRRYPRAAHRLRDLRARVRPRRPAPPAPPAPPRAAPRRPAPPAPAVGPMLPTLPRH